jgi:hypothetical protein
MSVGFVKLYRRLTEWEWYTDANTARLFFHLLIKANFKYSRWRDHDLAPGQLITGRKQLSEQLNIPVQSIRTSLKRLQSTGEIFVKPTNKFSIITICNYDLYQSPKKQANQQLTNNQPSSNQQLTTSKKKRRKEGKKKTSSNPAAEAAWTTVLVALKQSEYSRRAADEAAHKLVVGPMGGYERIGQANKWDLKDIKAEFLRAYQDEEMAA